MDYQVFLLLLWKHAMVRKRRLLHTSFEYFGPLLYFAVLFGLKDYLLPSSSEIRSRKYAAVTDPIPITVPRADPLLILFHPDTLAATMLMDKVGASLHLKPLQHFPSGDYEETGYFPYTHTSQLKMIMSRWQPRDAIIDFQNMEGALLPDKLNYTIRMEERFFTNTYYAFNLSLKPHTTFGSNYETFMRIQWAVDTSYIQLRTRNNINQKLYLREFPYYHDERLSREFVCSLLRGLCWLSLVLPFVFVMMRLLEDRTSGIQELMKIEGVSLNYIGLSHFLNVLPALWIFSVGITIFLKGDRNPLIENSNGLCIFLMLLLYFNTVVGLAFVCSYIPNSTRYGAPLALLLYVATGLATSMFSGDSSMVVNVISAVFPHEPMAWFWYEVYQREIDGTGVRLSSMFTAAYRNNYSVFLTYVFLLVQAFILYLLAWYLSHVRPGRFGRALPWNFIFKKIYWYPKNVTSRRTVEFSSQVPRGVYFEPPPTNINIGIRVDNLTKKYRRHVVLKGISLEACKGEITVLVGDNGAGKTTLMSIITGMTSATEGRVYVNGRETVRYRDEVRKDLGFCPQHSLFFADLTVKEHVMFFTYLKRKSFTEAKTSTEELLELMGLSQSDSLVTQLSDGMKRRVQLACALAGDADVLILDEPTSGLDVETRRGLWNILLSIRMNRTIFMTTHFMEEAAVLSDRVAVIHGGKLRCLATKMHLFKVADNGYRLLLTTRGKPHQSKITSLIISIVANATLRENTSSSISYNLPMKESRNFPKMFAYLEARQDDLEIISIGVSIPALEETFLKLCNDDHTVKTEDEINSAPTSNVPSKRISGLSLYIHQFRMLLKRQIKYTYSRRWILAFVQLIIPVTMIIIITKETNNNVAVGHKDLSMPLNLDVYNDKPERRVLYLDKFNVSFEKFKELYSDVEFQESEDVASKVLRVGMTDIDDYSKYLIGIEIDEATATVLYTTTVRHAAPIALNMLSNLLTSRYIPAADTNTITTHNMPLKSNEMGKLLDKPKTVTMSVIWGICVSVILLVTNINAVYLPCKEQQTGARHIHILYGCPAVLHWATTLLFHLGLCTFTIILPTAFIAVILDRNDTINKLNFIVSLITVLILGSMSFFAFMYLLSMNFDEKTSSIILVVCVTVFGIITPLFVITEDTLHSERAWIAGLLSLCAYVMPPHTISTSVIRGTSVARMNTWCTVLYPQCPDIFVKDPGFDAQRCCEGKTHSYLRVNSYSPAYGICLLLAQFLIYMALVILTQQGTFNVLIDSVMNRRYKRLEIERVDKMAVSEINYVKRYSSLSSKEINDAVLVNDLHKVYVPLCRQKCNALRGVSFSVKQGECFGLLGKNGAGKSTIFKLLTTEECITRGRIFIKGRRHKRKNSKSLHSIGYCPQTFGLDMFLTGEENLALLLTLRGFHKKWIYEEIRTWLQYIGLSKFAHHVVSEYSSGYKRRLSVVAALCGGAPLVLLDDPTMGIDVTAKRRIWKAIYRAQDRRRSFIITSNSMYEMETRCSRIGILTAGHIRALGDAATLRAVHAHGHTLVIKLKCAPLEADMRTQVMVLKCKMIDRFNWTLKDEQQTMLHYQIKETMVYSELFMELEVLKLTFPDLIEDYTLSELPLEEVFLALTEEQENTELEERC